MSADLEFIKDKCIHGKRAELAGLECRTCARRSRQRHHGQCFDTRHGRGGREIFDRRVFSGADDDRRPRDDRGDEPSEAASRRKQL